MANHQRTTLRIYLYRRGCMERMRKTNMERFRQLALSHSLQTRTRSLVGGRPCHTARRHGHGHSLAVGFLTKLTDMESLGWLSRTALRHGHGRSSVVGLVALVSLIVTVWASSHTLQAGHTAVHTQRVWWEGCLCVTVPIPSFLHDSVLWGRSCRTAWASVVEHHGVVFAFALVNSSDMPMPAPGARGPPLSLSLSLYIYIYVSRLAYIYLIHPGYLLYN